MEQYIERVVDLTDPRANRIYNMSMEEARERALKGGVEAIREIDGSFAIVAQSGKTVRLARSLDRPLRYFLAKREEGPALIIADRIDTIHQWLKVEKLDHQFHPGYTRMVPAHYVVEIQLVGCPDPDPSYTRFFTPERGVLPPDTERIGRAYIGALAEEISKWLRQTVDKEPIGVCFSGGIDSGAVFLTTYHVMQKLGLNLGRLKAFTLDFDGGPDLHQARGFLESIDPGGLGLFLEPVKAALDDLDIFETIRVVEDYKPLDIESATMALALCRGLRERYPDWRYLIDGDGGDENLKDYPIEDNPELTIRSVVNNMMLYQEGWGVGKIKHSLTYSGGLSRSYVRTYAPALHYNFEGFSPFTRPGVIEVAEGIPFIALTDYNIDRLYELKGEIVSLGVKAVTGMEMPVFPKRRFQDGALRRETFQQRFPSPRLNEREADYRKRFLSLYA
jgi:asparagine synthase (glutamine-hydrolysing)